MFKRLILLAAIALVCTNQVGAWELLPGKPNVDMFVTSADEQRIIAFLYTGGYWLTNDGGNTWEPISETVNDEHRAWYGYDISVVDAAADTVITRGYYGEYPGIEYPMYQAALTKDGGQSWFFPIGYSNSSDFMICNRGNHRTLMFTTSSRFKRSINFGMTWGLSVVYDPYVNQKLSLSQDAFHDSTLFATGIYFGTQSSGLWRSDDLGETWEWGLPDVPYYPQWNIIMMPDIDRLSNDDLLLTIQGSPSSDEACDSFLRSPDDGETWSEEYPLPYANSWPVQVVELTGNEGHLLLRCQYGREFRQYLYESDDYGNSFSLLQGPALHDVVRPKFMVNNPFNQTTYVATAGNGAWKTDDQAETWQSVPMPDLGSHGFAHIAAEYISYVGEYSADVFVKRDVDPQIQSFSYPPPAADSLQVALPIIAVDGTTIRGMFMRKSLETEEGYLYVVESIDNGQTWYDPIVSLPMVSIMGQTPITFCEDGGQNYILVSTQTGDVGTWSIYLSDDGGLTWTAETFNAYEFLTKYEVYDGQLHAIRRNEGVYRRPLDSDEWEFIPHTDMDGFNAPAATLLTDFDTFYTLTDSMGYLYQRDEWDTLGPVPDDQLRFAGAIPRDGQPPILFASSNMNPNLFVSYDGGFEWDTIHDPQPFVDQMARLAEIEYDPNRNRLWLNTPLGLMWEDADLFLGVGEPEPGIPLTHKLLNVYPNPFNSQATATVTLDRARDVKMVLFNTLGQEVQTLADGRLSAGDHSFSIDAASLASGTYFLRATTGDGTASVRKIELVR